MWSNLLYWSCCQRATSATAKANTSKINPLLWGRRTTQRVRTKTKKILKCCFHNIALPPLSWLSLAVWILGCGVLLPVRRGVCCGDRLLTLASTVLEIRGWIPRVCWCRLPLLVWGSCITLLRHPPSSIKFREIEPVVTHKPMCHWIFIMYLIWGGRDSWDVAAPPPPPRPATQHPVIEAPKMWLSFSASGTWLINYTLASALNSLNKPLHIISQVYPNFTAILYVFIWENMWMWAPESGEDAQQLEHFSFDRQPAHGTHLCGIIM